MNLLKSKGLTDQQIGNYRSIIAAFLNGTETTEPGSTAKARRTEKIARCHEQRYPDQPYVRRLAELIFTCPDQRDTALPLRRESAQATPKTCSAFRCTAMFDVTSDSLFSDVSPFFA